MYGASSIALRIWRDSAVRSLPLWLAITLLISDVLALLVVLQVARRDAATVPTWQAVLILWLPIAVFLMIGRIRARSHRLDLALPIPARQLWLSHSLATALAAGVVLAAGFGVLALIGLLMRRLDAGSAPELSLQGLALPIAAATLLATLFAQRLQPATWKPVNRGRDWGLLVGGLILIPVVLLLLEPWPLVATGVFAVGAALLARNVWAALPDALELTPMAEARRRDPEPARGASAAAAIPAGTPSGPLPIARLVFRILHNAPPWRQLMPWVLYSVIALVSFFLAGGFGRWAELDESRILNLPLGAYMLFAGVGMLTYHLHRLDALPVSRRALFGILVLPSLAVFCLGWAAGRLTLTTTAEGRQRVEYRISGDQQWVQIPPQYLAYTTDAEVPILTSPWGEAHPAWQRPLFRGSRVVVYSPFNTPEPSSARFEALMASRAIARVFGHTVPAAEIQRRYFQVEDDRIVALKEGGWTLSADYPVLTPPPEVAGSPFFMAATLAPWLLLLALFVRTFRATSSIRFIRWVYWAFLLLLLAALAGQVIAAIARLYSPDAAWGLLAIWLLRLESEPLLVAAAWLASLAVIALSYALAESGFRRAELPASPLQCSLVDWGKGG